MRFVLPVLLLLLCATPASARFTPVLRVDVPKLVKRRARVYLARTCRVQKTWYVPGDSFIATHLMKVRRWVDPTRIGCKSKDSDCVLPIGCLSKTKLDYSLRRKQSLEQLGRDLIRDVPRLTSRYLALLKASKYGELKETFTQSERRKRYYAQLKRLDWRLRLINHYRNLGWLRRALKAEGGWLQSHPKQFIMDYVGKRSKKLAKLFWDLSWMVDRTLKFVLAAPYNIYWKRKKLAKMKVSDKYKKLRPDLRGEVIARDVADVTKEIVRYVRNERSARRAIRECIKRHRLRVRRR